MATTTGVVSNISTDKGVSKAGKPYTIYKAEVNGDLYIVGFDKPPFNTGDNITFDWEVSFGKKQISKGTVAKSSGGAPTPSVGAGRAAYAAKVFPVPRDHGDRSIIRQNAVTNARGILLDSPEALPEGCTTEQYAARVIEIAEIIEAYTSGDYSVTNNSDVL